MLLLNIDWSLPVSDPVMQFLIILVIILVTPMIFDKIKIPSLLGLIIAGTAIGPYGLNLMERNSSFILFGTAGLLFIMFQAGLDTDINEFKKNSKKSVLFGILTFLFPFLLSFAASYFIFGLGLMSSVLVGSMIAPHTPITYPIVTKFDIQKNIAVSIALGGTLITNIISFLIIIVVVGMSTGDVNQAFWVRLSISVIVFAAIIAFLFPLISRWFFKRYQDNSLQFVFVLVMLFLGAFLAQLAGLETIIGALCTGMALNRMIPRTSPLMNRINYVSNSIFIPFFLIGVGMLVDLSAFVKDIETIKVAVFLTFAAVFSKYMAALVTQKALRFSADQKRVISGLSSAQAASTLAVVMVGYNIIIGTDENGESIRLLNDAILNGSLIMILISCTMSALQTQKGAKNIAMKEAESLELNEGHDESAEQERILIPVSNMATVEELVNLSTQIASQSKNKRSLYGLNIITSNKTSDVNDKNATKILDIAADIAAGADHHLVKLVRYDVNIVNGISNVIKENKISDLVLGIYNKKGLSNTFIGHLNEGILAKSNVTTLIYKSEQPISTIKRHLIFVPQNAEKELGFAQWLLKVWNIARNSGSKLVFYAASQSIKYINEVNDKYTISCECIEFTAWNDFLVLSRDVEKDDNLIFILSRREGISYHNFMKKIPEYLNKYFESNSFILIYPTQIGVNDIDYTNKVGKISENIADLFRAKR